jgi:hypothetical protein
MNKLLFVIISVSVLTTYASPIEVYYMQGVMQSFEKWGKLLEEMHFYHGGIGFKFANGDEYMCEYYAEELVHAVIPIVEINKTSNEAQVIWNNQAVIGCESFIDPKIWVKQTHIADINQYQFTDYIQWAKTYNETDLPNYYMFTIWDHWNKNVIMNSSNCFDFIWDSFDYLHSINTTFDESQVCKRDYVNFYVKTLTEVDYSDSTWKYRIDEFYELFQFANQTLTELFMDLVSTIKYPIVYMDETYYSMNMNFPDIGFHFIEKALP